MDTIIVCENNVHQMIIAQSDTETYGFEEKIKKYYQQH